MPHMIHLIHFWLLWITLSPGYKISSAFFCPKLTNNRWSSPFKLSAAPSPTIRASPNKKNLKSNIIGKKVHYNNQNSVLLGLRGISLLYGHRWVLKDVSFDIKRGDKLGLIGPNGSGKSSLLKIISGDLLATSGDLTTGIKAALLPQEFSFTPTETIGSILFKNNNGQDSTSDYGDLTSNQSFIKKWMSIIGFNINTDISIRAETLSGGYQMRLALCKLLIASPDLLLLDEPNNHLDVETLIWLQNLLQNQIRIPFILVTHSTAFAAKICNKYMDLDNPKAQIIEGNFTQFQTKRKLLYHESLSCWESQQKRIKTTRNYIREHYGQSQYSEKVNRLKQELEDLQNSPDYIKIEPKRSLSISPPTKKDLPKINFLPKKNQQRLFIDKLAFSYPIDRNSNESEKNTIFNNVTLNFYPGEKIAVLGRNGLGKSTFLKLLSGELTPDEGKITPKPSPNRTHYYTQTISLDPKLNVLQTISQTMSDDNESEDKHEEAIRLLALFQFRGEQVLETSVSKLSGGEKARLSLCRMMCSSTNILLLDEPTNHLDKANCLALEMALQSFPGILFIVSHDLEFMSKIANSILLFQSNKSLRKLDSTDIYNFLNSLQKTDEFSSLLNYDQNSHIFPSPTIPKNENSWQLKNSEKRWLEKKKTFGGKGRSGKIKHIKNLKRWN